MPAVTKLVMKMALDYPTCQSLAPAIFPHEHNVQNPKTVMDAKNNKLYHSCGEAYDPAPTTVLPALISVVNCKNHLLPILSLDV